MTFQVERRKLHLVIFLVLPLIFVFVAINVSAGNAASFHYANNINTPENIPRESGQRSTVVGGSSSVALGIGSHTIRTYYPHPGYQVVAFNTGNAGMINNIRHQTAKNARSNCSWSFQNIGGNAKLDCWVH